MPEVLRLVFLVLSVRVLRCCVQGVVLFESLCFELCVRFMSSVFVLFLGC